MSLYDEASLIMYPSGYKEDKLYSIKPTNGDGDFDFTRASSATRVNSDGLIEDVPYNLGTYSNDLDQWIKSNATATSGQSGYDGSNDAWLVTSTAINGHVRRNITLEGELTFSVYAKAGTADGIRIRLDASSDRNLYVNLSTGTLIIDGTDIGYNIANVGNDWYRISSINNLDSLINYRIYPVDATGSGVVGTIYVQDTQLVKGSEAKTYFETTDGLNVPRIDYTGGGCGKLLLEPQRTNLVTQSEAFDNAYWVKTGSTVSANTITSPDGTINADTLIESALTEQHKIHRNFASISASTPYSYSIRMKPNGRQWVWFNQNGLDNARIFFDIQNAVVGTISNTATTTYYNASIEPLLDGWVEISFSFTTTFTAFYNHIFLTTADNTFTAYLGDGTSGVYIWGAQLEQGSYPTSYIPSNSGSQTTRTADACNGAGNDQVINSTEGVLYVEMNAFDNISRISLSDGSTSNRVSFRITDDNIDFQYRVGGSYSYRVDVDIDTSNTNKIAMSFNNGIFVGYLNGVAIGSPISGPSLSQGVLDRLNFNDGNSSDSFEGNIKEVQIYNTALTDQELINLTTL